jgi:hypothetical protein
MAVDANSTIISVVGGGAINKKDIAVMTANGGINVYETDKDIFVNSVKEEFINQRVEKNYSNVTQSTTNVTNYPGGDTAGQVQFFGIDANSKAVFQGIPELSFTYSNATTSWQFQVIGNAKASNLVSTGTVDTPNISVSDTINITKTISVGGNTGNVVLNNSTVTGTGPVSLTGNVELGNLTVGNTGNVRTATVTGNLSAANASLGNLVTANYIEGTLAANSNAQPNVTSVSTVLTVGNVLIEGNTAAPQIIANNKPFSIGAYSPNGTPTTYLLSVETSGNVTLPVANTGTTVLTSADDIIIKSGAADFTLYQNGHSNLNGTATANIFSGNIQGVNANFSGNVTFNSNVTIVADTTTNNVTSNNITASNVIIAANVGNSTAYGNFFGKVANFGNINASDSITANANVNAKDILATGNINVNGNLYVQGNTSYVNINNLNVEDPIISLGGDVDGNSATTGGDRGLWLRSNVSDKFIGWDNANTRFIVASSVTLSNSNSSISTSTLGNIAAANFIGNVVGDVTGNVSGGNIQGNLINGNSSVSVEANGNVILAATGSNTVTVTGTSANISGILNVTGNVNVGGQINGDGTSLTAAQGTSNVVITNNGNITFAAAGNTARFTVTGTGANASNLGVTGNVTAVNFVGNLANGNSSITIASSGNINMIGDGNTIATVSNTTFTVSGNTALANATSTGNITAVNFVGTLANGTSNISIDQDMDVLITSAGTTSLMVTGIGANVIGDMDVSGNLTAGNFAVDTISIGNAIDANVAGTTFNLLNVNVTTAYFGGAATAINMGATTGTLTINNPTVVGSQLTQDLFNTVATTLNIGGAATATKIGASTGDTTIGNALVVTGNLSIIGGGLTTNATAFTLANANATTINFAGAADTINIGNSNATATTTLGSGILVGTQATQNLFNTTATTINLGGAADINLSGSGKTTTVAGGLTVSGNASFTGANITFSNVSNLHIKSATAVGQYLRATDTANGNVAWANVNWSDLATNDSTRGPNSIALGDSATAGLHKIAIGTAADATTAGIAIGQNAGKQQGVSGSIEINATGTAVTATASAAGFYVKPVRNATADNFSRSLVYDFDTGEIGFSTAGATTAQFADQAALLALSGNVLSNVTIPAAGGNVTINSGGNATVQVSATAATVTGNLTVTGVNLLANSATTANLGNAVTANYFIGSGANLTNIPGANVTGTVNNAANATVATTANSVGAGNITGTTLAATVVTSSLTAVGTLGSLSVTGDIAAATGNINATTGVFNGDGGGLSNIATANIVGAMDTAPDALSNVAIANGVLSADIGAVNTTFGNVVTLTIGGVTYKLLAV